MSQLTLTPPTFEQHPTGFGIGSSTPRISWRFIADDNVAVNWQQSEYELEVVRGHQTEIYHTKSAGSVLVPWPSQALQSREIAQIRVRSYGGPENAPTGWSAYSTVECGLLSREDWRASAITSPVKQADGPLRPIRFRKTFTLPTAVIRHARLYITSLGVFQAYINGKRVGDHCMAPGWTSYHNRLNYEVFNVASLLQHQENTIAIEVSEGWYATRLGFHGGRRFIYGDELAAFAQLEVTAGEIKEPSIIVTNSSWESHQSAIIRSEIYDGEVYDAREEQDHWKTSSSGWGSVREIALPPTQLVAPNAPPVRVTEVVNPIEIIRTPSGKVVLDFGQNLVGRIRIHSVKKPEGHSIVLSHAEVLEDGELGTRPLRVAKAQDEIISANHEIRDWAPSYTFHGFRYLQVDGWSPEDADTPLTLQSLAAEVIHTDLERSGWFKCSHEMVNKLHQNAIWSMRGNFLSVPTDCPQRDERMGWTGDLQIFAPSASFLYNTGGMLSDWLQGLSAEQLAHPKAIPPLVVPNVIDESFWPTFPQAVWDDITIILPWTLYQSYGDANILRQQYPSMTGYLDRGVQRGPDRLWDDTLFQLGDWLDPTAPPDQPGNSRTDGTLVADAYLVYITGLLSRIASILDEEADATRYGTDYRTLKSRFQTKYISPEGLLIGDTQTALSLALVFDLHDDPIQARAAGERLARLVRIAKFQVSTGFAGTPLITHALTKANHHQLAYRMLQEKNCPSWMYPITMGATTLWERWDSMLPDGSINPGEMTSFNHYALGSIINWLHATVAGIRPGTPGWREIIVKPLPGGTVTFAEARYETVYGRVEIKWEVKEGDQFKLELIVPPNSMARVILPGDEEEEEKVVGSGRYTFEKRFDSRDGWPPKALVPPMFEAEDTFV
ncbi:bacterial alpha-L-rhamnosidase-domain-containing protein [Aspergillus stella-maris]|uniref:bacterial alpha-L-rhamnosidase-domain-containing protein n=1 Tax=Aspergillus stella-maris TaxID=1810926 RepID=UPI003CCD8FCA